MRCGLKSAVLVTCCLETLSCGSNEPFGSSANPESHEGPAANGGATLQGSGRDTSAMGGSGASGTKSSTRVGGSTNATTSTERPGSGGASASESTTAGGKTSSARLDSGGASSRGGSPTAGTDARGGAENGGTEQYPDLANPPADEDGAELWLRYKKVPIPGRLAEYQSALTHLVRAGDSAPLKAIETELVKGLSGLTGKDISISEEPTGDGAVVFGTPESSSIIKSLNLADRLSAVGDEGYVVIASETSGKKAIVVAGNTDVGVLRGGFALLRHLQCHSSIKELALSGAPKIKHRLLNHWDNPNGTVERGYAGKSIWSWSTLPGAISSKYKDYARANASIGINGAVLNNVNADAQMLSSQYIAKIAALADTFRPYGIRVYLSARFSAPSDIGGLSTTDPLDAGVKQWWADKADEIYAKIPDFGGFLVKANSEGQPGPQKYNRTHADGANTLAEAIGIRGVVLWRAFVYSSSGSDRIRQAYDEFKPLDGKFAPNALVQVKNGPLDFQPREPFHPLFGAMPQTPLALELQVTKEYLGEDTHLAYLGPLYQEVLKADTYASGEGSTVARVIDGSLHKHSVTAISGVANIGGDTNWTGSHFNQANWYVFGRMAWDPDISAEAVAEEWVRQTLSNDPAVVTPITSMMMGSRQHLVDYMTPLGLVHIMATDHHYGPGPWVNELSTAEWNPTYYHKADASGIGFDRTSTGSKAVEQYFSPVRDEYGKLDSVPVDLLLFFHHVGWNMKLSTGRSVWDELVHRYSQGVDGVGVMRDAWKSVEGRIDTKRFGEVDKFLQIQHWEARWWRDACLQYFASISKLAIASGYATPANPLSYYKGLTCPSDPTKPRCDAIYKGDPSPAILP